MVASVVPRFVNASSVVKKEVCAPEEERTIGTTTTRDTANAGIDADASTSPQRRRTARPDIGGLPCTILRRNARSRRRSEPDLGEEPLRVLAETRRSGGHGVDEAVEEERRADRGHGPSVPGRLEDRSQRRRLRRANRLENPRDGPGGNPGGLEALEPGRARLFREERREDGNERLAVDDARGLRREARV